MSDLKPKVPAGYPVNRSDINLILENQKVMLESFVLIMRHVIGDYEMIEKLKPALQKTTEYLTNQKQ